MITFISTVNKFDLAAFRWCMSRKYIADIASVSRWISKLGDGHLYVLVGGLLYWLDTMVSNAMLKTALLAFAIELPLYLALKNSIKRNRPSDVIYGFKSFLVPSDKFSFPSGHTAAAFLMASVSAFYYPPLFGIVFLIAALIGVSRVLLGVHFPTDIVAGIVLGSGSALIAIYALGI